MDIKKRLEKMKLSQGITQTEIPKNEQETPVTKPSLATNWVDSDPSDPKTKKHPCKLIVTGKVIKIIQTDTNKKMILTPSPEDIAIIKNALNR